MYCSKCGQQIPDDSKFCNFCGEQVGSQKKTKGRTGGGFIAFIVLGAILGLVALIILGINSQPVDGWKEINGNTYYMEDGSRYVGWWEIDGCYYYFDEEGILLTSTTAEIDEGTLGEVDESGKMVKIRYSQVIGNWSSDRYNSKNSGYSPIMEFEQPIEKCVSTDFYLEASGNYNTSMNGNWVVCFKIGGKWEKVTSFEYSGNSGMVNIEFDKPVTIEAITAYPTKRGNYSGETFYALQNVWCYFE